MNLAYPDPDKDIGSVAEIDSIVNWGPFLVLVEAKAKQFRTESQLGDAGRLRSDIKANIEDAFEQGKRAARYIRETDFPEFKEYKRNRKLRIDKSKIHRTYFLTVSQHHLCGLATHLTDLQELGLFKDGEYPFSTSIADLETVAEFCDGPEVFLHYIERMLDIQKKPVEIHADDLGFFGAYLETRLRPERFLVKGRRKPNFVNLLGWSEQFDTWMQYKRGEISTNPSIELNVPNEIREILTEVRKSDHNSARWIAFALLDMSDNGLGAIAKGFGEIRIAQLTPGKFRRLVVKDEDTVISITASLDLPRRLLHERTKQRAWIEKYRHKTLKSISFGIMVLDAKPFECATWLEGPWELDEQMEKAIEDEPDFVPIPGQRLPGRNEPCICGSGKKYKKCCLQRFREEKK